MPKKAATVPLRDYTDMRFGYVEKIGDMREAAGQLAITVALSSLVSRLDHANNVNGQIKEKVDVLATNDRVDGLDTRLQTLERGSTGTTARTEGLVQWYGWIAGGVGLLIGLGTLVVSFLKWKGGSP